MPKRLDLPPPTPADPAAAAPRPGGRAASDHWKKLLRQPAKGPRRVSVAEFVAELNQRLRADANYREGTRFIVAGPDDTRPGGATWEGPMAMKPVVIRIVQGAIGEFDVELPFFSDR